MKLAQALIERADLQKTIAQVESRMRNNAKVQEGDEPVEKMEKLFALYEELMEKLEALIVKINRTNNEVFLDENTLAQAITKRDCLKAKIAAYQRLYSEASITTDRYSRSEVKFVRCVDLAKLQKSIDGLSKQYRELDTRIQELNWNAEVV